MSQLIKYDLACGQRKTSGFIGVDAVKLPGVDIQYDLTRFPWTFAQDHACTEVVCHHFFEHLTGTQRTKFMNELYRILILGGRATLVTPYYTSVRASQDPTHQWPPISEASYLYFNRDWLVKNKLEHYPIRCNFDLDFAFILDPHLDNSSPSDRKYAMVHYWNAVADLKATLTKRPL